MKRVVYKGTTVCVHETHKYIMVGVGGGIVTTVGIPIARPLGWDFKPWHCAAATKDDSGHIASMDRRDWATSIELIKDLEEAAPLDIKIQYFGHKFSVPHDTKWVALDSDGSVFAWPFDVKAVSQEWIPLECQSVKQETFVATLSNKSYTDAWRDSLALVDVVKITENQKKGE